ncbi:lymphoid enhancer-binding factor 1-like [Salvelinus fontinalis]|uniref:lymphoid enhancer-binding factor 1-like n=1 Tax=Salvelinus fontinalis TaxID=8038 RepID=UPI0024864DD0|nr:lymphoid enhancer-binding factor 1-like [Salvelinus fontinalis]
MPQLAGGGGGGDPELCATDEMIPFKDEGDQEQIFAELSHSEEDEGDLADIKSSLVHESETSPNSNHDGTRQSQISQDSYHEKHRDHHDDGKHLDMYNKGHPYSGYPGYIMMTNMNNDSYMNNGSLSPPMPRTVSPVSLYLHQSITSTHLSSLCIFTASSLIRS